MVNRFERIDYMKTYKHLFIGIFIGVLLATAIPAGAAAVYKSLNAVERPDYKIVVDGKEIKLNNPPKTIEGSAHLPIRDIADIFGSDVDFKNKTITLTSKGDDKVNKVENEIVEPSDVKEPIIPKHEKIDDLDKDVWVNLLNQRELAKEKYQLSFSGDTLGNQTISGNQVSISITSKDFPENGDYTINVDGHDVRVKVVANTKFFNIPDLISAGMIAQ